MGFRKLYVWTSSLMLGLGVLATSAVAASDLLPVDGQNGPAVLQGKTSAGTWMHAEGLLGGEREEGPVAEGWRVAWDGMDGDPSSLDATGLGGVDLTAIGFGDRLIASWGAPLDGVAWVEVTVWTREDRHSRARIHLAEAGALRQVAIPFSALNGDADLRDVGALELVLGGSAGEPPAFDGLAVGFKAGAEMELDPRARPTPLGGAPVPATLVLQDGDTPTNGGGNSVTSLNSPFVNGNGEVGFTGQLDNGGSADGFVFVGAAIAQLNSTVVGVTLTGAEGSMGIDDTGGFFYSPSTDGSDSVWSQNGQVAIEDVQAPGFPGGTNSTFHSRPSMSLTGASHWISGFNESGGTSTEGRMLYSSSDATAANTAVVLRSDDLIDGVPIDRPSGVDFDFDFSNDGNHSINVLLLDTGSTADDGVVYVDGAVVAAEGSPSGAGDNWDNFDGVVINDSGDYLFSGDTDGDTGSDEFIAYNGTIAVREGAVVDGVVLGSSLILLSLDNSGAAVHGWSSEDLFFACDASALAITSFHLLSAGDSVDFNSDGIGDATVTDFNASLTLGPTQALAPDGRVFVEVDLDDGSGPELEAIISLDPPDCGQIIFTDGFESGDTTGWTNGFDDLP